MSCELLVLISASCIDALATDFGLLEVIWSYLASVPKIESPIMVYITRILSSMLSISPKIVRKRLNSVPHPLGSISIPRAR